MDYLHQYINTKILYSENQYLYLYTIPDKPQVVTTVHYATVTMSVSYAYLICHTIP